MPQLLPFAGLRPDPALTGPLNEVICPPYDIISAEERLVLLERSPYNIVRVELPDGHYREAASLFEEWKASRALARETAPALYGYRMSYRSVGGEARQTYGLMGALVLEPPGHGILPHERTTPKAKSDRLELIRAVHANTSPIWCLCTVPGLAGALGQPPPSSGPGAPPASARDDEGTLHEIWPVTDKKAHAEVAKIVQARPLLVADGHHRYETALAYQAEQRARALTAGQAETAEESTGGYNAVLAFAVELSGEHLDVLAIHRLVSGMPPGFDLLGLLSPGFELDRSSTEGPALLAEMATEGALAVVTPGANWLAKPRPTGPEARYDLDSSRIDAALHSLPPHALSYEHDPARAIAEVRSGKANAAIFCRPATIDQIARTAEGGERMAPKTTFFWPKPRTGMVMRDFAGPGNS